VVPGPRGQRGRSDSGELAGGLGRGSGWEGSRVHEGSIWALTCGGEMAGGPGRRGQAAAAAAALIPANRQLGLGNKPGRGLYYVLGTTLVGTGRLGKRTVKEFDANSHGGAVVLASAHCTRPASFTLKYALMPWGGCHDQCARQPQESRYGPVWMWLCARRTAATRLVGWRGDRGRVARAGWGREAVDAPSNAPACATWCPWGLGVRAGPTARFAGGHAHGVVRQGTESAGA
jgi:hypothetical protein